MRRTSEAEWNRHPSSSKCSPPCLMCARSSVTRELTNEICFLLDFRWFRLSLRLMRNSPQNVASVHEDKSSFCGFFSAKNSHKFAATNASSCRMEWIYVHIRANSIDITLFASAENITPDECISRIVWETVMNVQLQQLHCHTSELLKCAQVSAGENSINKIMQRFTTKNYWNRRSLLIRRKICIMLTVRGRVMTWSHCRKPKCDCFTCEQLLQCKRRHKY